MNIKKLFVGLTCIITSGLLAIFSRSDGITLIGFVGFTISLIWTLSLSLGWKKIASIYAVIALISAIALGPGVIDYPGLLVIPLFWPLALIVLVLGVH